MLAGVALLAGAVTIGRSLAAARMFDYEAGWWPRSKKDDQPFVLKVFEQEWRLSKADAQILRKDLQVALDEAEEAGYDDLDGLSGAVKVCVNYFRSPSGKIRCRQWSSGAGYTPGPQSEPNYFIPDVRSHYATELCTDPKNKRKCGLSRKYHYRQSLPYIPRERAGSNAPIPRIASAGAVRILTVHPASPLRSKTSHEGG